MKRRIKTVAALTMGLLSSMAAALPLSPTAKTFVPADVRQVISIDYHMLRHLSPAIALKAQVLPENLQQFESALKSVGVNPDSDLENLTVASFDDDPEVPRTVALASGTFSSMAILTQLSQRQVSPVKYSSYSLYSVSKTVSMTILGNNTLLLGDTAALKSLLRLHDSHTPSIETNKELSEAMKPVDRATVWSVLDRKGTQRLLLTTLGGECAKLPDFTSMNERILSSYFRMNFREGVRFDMDVLTSDASTSAKLTSLLKIGILYKKITANPAQKVALDNVNVTARRITDDSDVSDLQMQFKVDQQQLQTLLRSQCFSAMSNERKEFSGFTSALTVDDLKANRHNSANAE